LQQAMGGSPFSRKVRSVTLARPVCRAGRLIALVGGSPVAGPAVVEERECTAVIPAGATAWAESGHPEIERAGADEGGAT
jgi:hypothetical protein